MLKLALGSIARNAGSAAAGWLVAHGIATGDQTAMVVNIVGGLVIYAATQGWSLLHKSGKVSA